MNHEYGYEWKSLRSGLIPLLLLVGYIVWRGGNPKLPVIIVLSGIAIYVIGKNLLPLCRVVLTDSQINLSFLLPIRKGGTYRHEEIASYHALTTQFGGNEIVVGGILQTKDGAKMMLMSGGTMGFDELNEVLIEIYPRPSDADQNK